jgi:hypothetical protein
MLYRPFVSLSAAATAVVKGRYKHGTISFASRMCTSTTAVAAALSATN